MLIAIMLLATYNERQMSPAAVGGGSDCRQTSLDSVSIIRPAQTAPFVKTGLFPKMFVKALKDDLLEVNRGDFRLFCLSDRSA